MLKRIITAAILLPLVVGLILAGPVWAVPLLIVIIVPLAFLEFGQLTALGVEKGKMMGLTVISLLAAACLIRFRQEWVLPMVLVGATMVAFVIEMARPSQIAASGAGLVAALGGFLYTVLLPIHMAWLFMVEPNQAGIGGRHWLMLVLALTWVGDSAAYFVGKAIGKHKLYPAISPNKTWEGAVAGLVGSVLTVWIARQFFMPQIGLWEIFLIGIPASILGQLGDFSESLLKRAAGVKDSGSLFPGHGGALDRLDALFFAVPFLYYYLILIHPAFAAG